LFRGLLGGGGLATALLAAPPLAGVEPTRTQWVCGSDSTHASCLPLLPAHTCAVVTRSDVQRGIPGSGQPRLPGLDPGQEALVSLTHPRRRTAGSRARSMSCGSYYPPTQTHHRGGGIELSILSEHYGRVIAAYDIQTKRCDRCVVCVRVACCVLLLSAVLGSAVAQGPK
jgi:hypothetical protein